MSADDITPQVQAYPPRLVLTWVLRGITSALFVSGIGVILSAFPDNLHLQIIGSGWWQDGGAGMGGLLLALSGFSSKVSALVSRRESGIQWLRRAPLRDFVIEFYGLAVFVCYGVLPLSIHSFTPLWSLLMLWGMLAGGWHMSAVKPIRRKVEAILGTGTTGTHNGATLVADSSRLSRRALLSGGLTLGISAAGLAALWRALPALIPDYTFFGHDAPVRSLSWFPDGRRISSIDMNGQVLIWNAADGSNPHASARLKLPPTKVQVSPNGNLVAASDYGSLYMADVATGTTLWIQKIGYSDRPFSWAPDGTHVALISYGSVRTIDAVTGEEATTVFLPPANFAAQAVAWSPDGKSIAATDGAQIVLWDAVSGMQGETFTLPVATGKGVSDFSWSPGGRAVAVALERVVYIWSLDNAAAPIAYRDFVDRDLSISLSWSPDGRYIASCGSFDKTVRVWEAATGKTVFVYNGHFSSVEAVAWSPDGRRIASGGWDNLVHVWRPALPA